MSRHTHMLGKVDYEGQGARNECEVDWSLEEQGGRLEFAGSAGIWNTRSGSGRDYLTCGQCVEEVCALFPDDAFAQRFLVVWREWHLNGMNAGTPAQAAALEPVKDTFSRLDWYPEACAYLEGIGLNPDPAGDGTGPVENAMGELVVEPYRYGSKWLYRPLPPDVIAEIRAWPGVRTPAR